MYVYTYVRINIDRYMYKYEYVHIQIYSHKYKCACTCTHRVSAIDLNCDAKSFPILTKATSHTRKQGAHHQAKDKTEPKNSPISPPDHIHVSREPHISTKRALYLRKRALYLRKRALYLRKTALYLCKRPLYSLQITYT